MVETGVAALSRGRSWSIFQRAPGTRFFWLWLLVASIAVLVSSLVWPSAHIGNELSRGGIEQEYLPVGVDSFYHARRILDTVADPAAFYEFDPRIHAPEGSLLPWPWGYDYAMAQLVRALAGLASPIAILIWIPVAAVFVSVGLMMLLARRLALPTWAAVIAGACVALSPLTQNLHGVGIIDHHFAEYILVLATLVTGLGWLTRPQKAAAAALLGVVLGIAPAIHNALFILQIPILAALLVLWLQNIRLPLRATLAFGAALLLSTFAVLLPSLPFRLNHFEFYTLSWFHLYVAAGTAVTAAVLAYFARSARSAVILVVMAVVLITPLGRQVLLGQSFLAGDIKRLEAIGEMRSLASVLRSPGGWWSVSLLYSALILLLPLGAGYSAFKAWQERASGRVFFWLCCLFGTALLVTQLRLQYFGSFVLYLPLLVLADSLARRRVEQTKVIALATALGVLLAYVLPIRYQLTSQTSAGGDRSFRALRPILTTLQQACARDPGIVLADNDAGHYIRYYTQCSVIANNFLLTRQHELKIEQIDYLTSLPATALPGAAPFVRYILVRPVSVQHTADGVHYMSYSQVSGELIDELLLRDLDQVPANYRLLDQANLKFEKEGEVPYIRLFAVVHPPAGATGASPNTTEK